MSLPSRERGLKCAIKTMAQAGIASLPSRERGLKYHRTSQIRQRCIVAPLAGAWIEIIDGGKIPRTTNAVAPLAGAWIEIILSDVNACMLLMSLPSRERGLKFVSGRLV